MANGRFGGRNRKEGRQRGRSGWLLTDRRRNRGIGGGIRVGRRREEVLHLDRKVKKERGSAPDKG